MKIIDSKNFFPTVCTVYTVLVIGKMLVEYIGLGIWENYQSNLLIMFVLSVISTFVLSQYYRFQKYPLLAVIVAQYLALAGGVLIFTWISGFFTPLHENGYRDMVLSFSIPYAVGVVVYYAALFREIRSANRTLKQIKDAQLRAKK